MTTPTTETVYRFQPSIPGIAELLNQLNPEGFITLAESSSRKWVQIPYDSVEQECIDALMDGTVPAVTHARWYDPIKRELWMPGAWLVEVQDAS
ncbi:MAG: hypothetical protein AAF773_05145 [Cyanobacteria bacterium P01_D01_bin.115]